MNVLEMSISAGILILAIIIIRSLFLNRLPKKTFLIMWGIVLIELLIPISISSSFSVYSLIPLVFSEATPKEEQEVGINQWENNGMGLAWLNPYNTVTILENKLKSEGIEQTNRKDQTIKNQTIKNQAIRNSSVKDLISKQRKQGRTTEINSIKRGLKTVVNFTPTVIIWIFGVISCGLYFIISYLKCVKKFREAIPVKNEFIEHWLREHKLKRNIMIKQTDRIGAPLTYGIIHPVILLPSQITWEDKQEILTYILEHEYIHIKRFDSIVKIVLATVLCIHWFNPLVFIMYILTNQDIELSCDEAVIFSFGETTKSSYAYALIYMEETKNSFMPLYNNFSKNSAKERIKAIMKIRKHSFLTICGAVLVILGIATTFVALAATNKEESEQKSANEKNIADVTTLVTTDHSFSMADTTISMEKDLNTQNVLKNTDSTSNPVSAKSVLTKEEYEEVKALQFENYKDMTISEYRKKNFEFRDTAEHMDRLEQISQNESFYELRYKDELADFFFNLYQPVTAEQYKNRFFGNFAGVMKNGEIVATLEYNLTRTLYDTDKITMKEHETALKGIMDGLESFLQSKNLAQLAEQERMVLEIEEECNRLIDKYRTDSMDFFFNDVYYQTDLANEESRKEFKKTIQPYLLAGLVYDEYTFDMYWKEKEVRAIFDLETGSYITLHIGLGFSADAVDLYTVYENGILVGLREATKEEQEEETKRREKRKEEEEDIRKRDGNSTENAVKEDYENFFSALYTKDYKNKTVSEFNLELLEWANENQEAYERIIIDTGYQDYKVDLSEEERSFCELTAYLSGQENTAYVRSIYKNEAEKDIELGYFELTKQEPLKYQSCIFNYWMTYHILDKTKLTIEKRDTIFLTFKEEINKFWDNLKIEEAITMNEETFKEKLDKIAEQCSTKSMEIRIQAVQIEAHDESDLMKENEIEQKEME